ncbi:aminotransferase class III-fold pyridoxal phosphate-dependent enzyme [Helicobacter cappadocius]|uniref:Aminotransferase class III-fold pyridoxal phosphate-dependent enzyme n=1 Tax=Helicobacter cappadocius TaxID=3063998 RepID=A0AA90PQ12_9HELI|nr:MULTISPECIES: aminotransferase class III-fold pyridoxal phosphate-dependent enzyme [unclassified Helicobacter]MDO7252733.1 aminotransferase class III-fold pyridoxal phosphate-dependent enzyme [Helicobacter sp. faydin-H75]MDP2538601.1 aminotransferase class III-fold pyridoxal phosphate-dependent enzyme [Helicobacter sp. faydin-H76]
MFDKNYKIDDLMEIDNQYILHTYERKKIRFAYGDGSKLYTPCSKQFIDFGSGIGENILGYGNPKFVKGISEQARDLISLSNYYLVEPQALLAKKILELSGFDARIFFGNSGEDANRCAIRIAKKFGDKDRDKIIVLGNQFYDRIMGENDFVSEYFICAQDIDDIYSLVDHKTCAIFMEFSEDGVEFLRTHMVQITHLADFLKKKKILFMVDENQSGVYRSGEIFVSSLYGLMPDVLTISGGLGGGVPIGATICSLKDIFTHGDYENVFGGNFLSSRAGLLVFEALEEEHKSGNLERTIDLFNIQLDKILKNFSNLFEKKVGVGLMLSLVIKDEKNQKNIIESAFEEQLLILKGDKDRIRFLPALNISIDEINEGFERLHKACEKL